MSWLPPALAGLITGVLSGFGIGGGTLLMIYMTAWAAIPQAEAQGVNLAYFLPTSAAALVCHVKQGFIKKEVVLPAAAAGIAAALPAAFAATSIETGLLKKAFGVYLLYIGLTELFGKSGKSVGEKEKRRAPPR